MLAKRLALSLAIAAGSASLSSRAIAQSQPVDRWSSPAPGLRVLERRARWSDGAPVSIFAARVDLCDPRVVLRVSSPREGGRTVSRFAAASRALVAVNGDYFDRTNLRPTGPSRASGLLWTTAAWTHHDSLVAIERDGRVSFRDVAAPGTSALSALFNGPDLARSDVISGRERVLVDGRTRLSPWVEHDGRRHPRTGVGLSQDRRTLWLVVIDGRSRQSAGATVEELAEALRSLGASDGVKLDGGGSSALFVRNRGVINRPSDGRERPVANHLAVVRGDPRSARPWCPRTGSR
ncbi:MAG: phosphodiester glycosidase family protein [Myxococcales bacterium]|nr:phosphodiester glycosidase family protein [Myxococcales bacterium]